MDQKDTKKKKAIIFDNESLFAQLEKLDEGKK
jgi:hypothetical protein